MIRLWLDPGDRRFIRQLVAVVVAVALVVLLYKLTHLLLLAFGAMLGALLLSSIADGIVARTAIPRGIALAIAVLAAIAILVAMGWLFGDVVANQATQLQHSLPQDWNRLKATLMADPIGKLLVSSIEQGTGGGGISAHIVSLGLGLAQVLGNFLIIFVGSVFFAGQPALYKRGLLLLFPQGQAAVAEAALDDTARALRLWLIAQLISMVSMGLMIGVGLWLSGVKLPIALGVLGGLSEFIPYVGPTLAMIPAFVVTLAGSGSPWGTILTFAIVRIVQANIITPLVTHEMVSVPPGLYLFLILAAGFAFGTYGLFFAGALAVAGYTLFIRLYLRETLGRDVALPGQD